MIDYGLFHFASAPRTATAWIHEAAKSAGIKQNHVQIAAHIPFTEPRQDNTFRLSCVRHPCDWLASYYVKFRPSFLDLPSMSKFCWHAETFDDFIRRYLDEAPGEVGRMMTGYNADSYIRVEDLPMAFVNFLEPFGVPRIMRHQCTTIKLVNATRSDLKPKWNKQLYDAVLRTETPFLERFEYWW